ncbi:ParB N-terminal domain-containing protein [Aliihoeflea sp. PC F10.4]
MPSMISIASIDAGNRLRALDPAWVKLLSEEIGTEGLQEPIRVVERGDRHQLVSGARRLAAAQTLGWKEISATVIPAAELADEASVRLAEIKADMLRGDLTVLDRARYLVAWRDAYETLHPAKRGRKAVDLSLDEKSAQCALIFTDAAQAALDLSRRTIFLLLKIASIDGQAATKIALHPSSDKRGELLLLAEQSAAMQMAVADMLTSEPATAQTVVDALLQLGTVPPIKPEPVYAKLSERFSRLPERERSAFLEMNESEIRLWIAKRDERASKAA